MYIIQTTKAPQPHARMKNMHSTQAKKLKKGRIDVFGLDLLQRYLVLTKEATVDIYGMCIDTVVLE